MYCSGCIATLGEPPDAGPAGPVVEFDSLVENGGPMTGRATAGLRATRSPRGNVALCGNTSEIGPGSFYNSNLLGRFRLWGQWDAAKFSSCGFHVVDAELLETAPEVTAAEAARRKRHEEALRLREERLRSADAEVREAQLAADERIREAARAEMEAQREDPGNEELRERLMAETRERQLESLYPEGDVALGPEGGVPWEEGYMFPRALAATWAPVAAVALIMLLRGRR